MLAEAEAREAMLMEQRLKETGRRTLRLARRAPIGS
jgi:hypothetical protein